jgi:hypothetical protein
MWRVPGLAGAQIGPYPGHPPFAKSATGEGETAPTPALPRRKLPRQGRETNWPIPAPMARRSQRARGGRKSGPYPDPPRFAESATGEGETVPTPALPRRKLPRQGRETSRPLPRPRGRAVGLLRLRSGWARRGRETIRPRFEADTDIAESQRRPGRFLRVGPGRRRRRQGRRGISI